MPPTTGTAEQELQRRLRHELHGDERPVRRGDERAALERRFSPGAPPWCERVQRAAWLSEAFTASVQHSLPLRYPALRVPSIDIRERHVRWRRLLAGGIVLTALAGIAGGRSSCGGSAPDDAAAARRVEAHINRRFDAMVRAITEVSARVARGPARGRRPRAPARRRPRVSSIWSRERAGPAPRPPTIAVTVYDKAASRAPGRARHRTFRTSGSPGPRRCSLPLAARAAARARPADLDEFRSTRRQRRGCGTSTYPWGENGTINVAHLVLGNRADIVAIFGNQEQLPHRLLPGRC